MIKEEPETKLHFQSLYSPILTRHITSKLRGETREERQGLQLVPPLPPTSWLVMKTLWFTFPHLIASHSLGHRILYGIQASLRISHLCHLFFQQPIFPSKTWGESIMENLHSPFLFSFWELVLLLQQNVVKGDPVSQTVSPLRAGSDLSHLCEPRTSKAG